MTSTAAVRARCSNAGATAASVVTTPSIVAIMGSIMPEPFAIPPMRYAPVAAVTSTAASFGNGSVVMMARAAEGPPSRSSAAAAEAMPLVTTSQSSSTPMTPVDATSTCSTGHPATLAVSAAIARASAIPESPVHAFAHPLLTTIARAVPPDRTRCSRETTTGP